MTYVSTSFVKKEVGVRVNDLVFRLILWWHLEILWIWCDALKVSCYCIYEGFDMDVDLTQRTQWDGYFRKLFGLFARIPFASWFPLSTLPLHRLYDWRWINFHHRGCHSKPDDYIYTERCCHAGNGWIIAKCEHIFLSYSACLLCECSMKPNQSYLTYNIIKYM